MRVLVVTNGDVISLPFLKRQADMHDMIICVDGAVRYVRPAGIVPAMLAGDLDSISREDLQWIKGKQIPVIRYETRKDYTDTELALRHAVEKGATHVTLAGALGSRIDHTLGNVFLLKLLWDHQVDGSIENETVELRIVGARTTLPWKRGETVSFTPLSDAATVSLLGFEYPLDKAVISFGSSRCISNVVALDNPVAWVENGLMLAIRNKKIE